jgi:TorA maturation chaperone TorD
VRDPGLNEAFRSTGGVTELARRLGISQPSVSNWVRVPAERVIAVETATGVSRGKLRPDLYGDSQENSAEVAEVNEIDAARAREYALIAATLARTPSADLLKRIGDLRADPSPLGLLHAELTEAAGETTVENVEREFFDLFIGLARGELLPYGSYYLTGFLHERPLARLRDDLIALGIERAKNIYEPEDHISILFEVMAGLADGRLPAPAGTDRKIFERHIKPWAARFFFDLENAKGAKFYRRVGTLGRVFMEIETEAFALAA